MRRPWFSYYVDDFDLAGKVKVMTAEVEGCYHRLLRFQWREGYVPDDVKEVAEICRQPYPKMRGLWPKLEPCFPLDGDARRNPRMEEEREKAARVSVQRSAMGKKGRAKQLANDGQGPGPLPGLQPEVSPVPCDSTTVHKSQTTDTQFDAFWSAYPKRAGSNPRKAALTAWSARCSEGIAPADLQTGVYQYADFCDATGKTGTEYVKQAVSWLSPRFEGWLQDWAAPEDPAVNEALGRLSIG